MNNKNNNPSKGFLKANVTFGEAKVDNKIFEVRDVKNSADAIPSQPMSYSPPQKPSTIITTSPSSPQSSGVTNTTQNTNSLQKIVNTKK